MPFLSYSRITLFVGDVDLLCALVAVLPVVAGEGGAGVAEEGRAGGLGNKIHEDIISDPGKGKYIPNGKNISLCLVLFDCCDDYWARVFWNKL